MRRRLAVSVLVAIGLGSCGGDEPITIMPIGDSITQGAGAGTNASYRCYLDEMLRDAGVAFDFVGSQTEPYIEGTDYGCPHDFDQDHEGYTGAGVEEAGMAALPAVQELQPDVALVHLGSNDIYSYVPPADAAADLESLISDLRVAQPTITILVAQIIPCGRPGVCFNEEIGPEFHDLVGSLASLSTDESTVMAVDMRTGFDTAWLPDDTHPNAAGDQFIASQWMRAMQQSGLLGPSHNN